jgi:uncharacterized membrane protein YphA (DoxX/SURF4 family)
MKFIRNFSRLFVGVVFIFSGIVKGVDPLGTAYRIEDYFIAYGLEWAIPLSLMLSVFLCTLEFMLGISLLFNAWIRRLAWLLFPIMIFFTLLTMVDAIWEPVPDCGCFGDAIKLSNLETFYKNIVLIVFTAIIFYGRKKFNVPRAFGNGFFILASFGIGFLWFSFYNLDHLPLADFREWKVGNDMDPENGGEPKIYLIFRNNESGEEKEYLSPDYPWQDSVWMTKWEFVDQRMDDSEVIKSHELIIESAEGEDMTSEFICNHDYQFIVVAYDLQRTDRDAFGKINTLFEEAEKHDQSLIVITSSLKEEVTEFRKSVQTDLHLDFYYGDDAVLKTIVRANPGLILFKDGVVIAKWHYNDLPAYEMVKEEFMKD